MGDVFFSALAENELKNFDPDDHQLVGRVISLLEDDVFRKHNKTDLILIENDYDVWSICVGRIWLAFVEEDDSIVKVVHISMLSRFRAPNLE